MMAREQGNAKSAALVDTPYPSAKKNLPGDYYISSCL
jgi:hypothetical protein